MGWGTEFKVDMYLSKETYVNKYQVNDKIDELNKSLNYYNSQLKMYASANPRDIIPKEWEDESIRWINDRIDELIEWIYLDTIHLYKLQAYIEYLEENNIETIKQND